MKLIASPLHRKKLITQTIWNYVVATGRILGILFTLVINKKKKKKKSIIARFSFTHRITSRPSEATHERSLPREDRL